jgi:hypothetical protein
MLAHINIRHTRQQRRRPLSIAGFRASTVASTAENHKADHTACPPTTQPRHAAEVWSRKAVARTEIPGETQAVNHCNPGTYGSDCDRQNGAGPVRNLAVLAVP